MIINEVGESESGEYKCEAVNDYGEASASGKLEVTCKWKLNNIWKFVLHISNKPQCYG